MTLLLPALAAAFAAFCVWLTVRIVNRRERWAKWTAVALAALLSISIAAYLLSYPLACAYLIHSGGLESPMAQSMTEFYGPFGWLFQHSPEAVQSGYASYNDWCLRLLGVPID